MIAGARIPRRIATQLLDHARQDHGREVCGLITARDGVPARCFPIANISDNPEHRYRMDPRAMINGLSRMEQDNETLYAIYHSHPVSPAVPSTIDVAEAGWPDALYLIISLNTRGVLEMRGYRIRDGKTREVPLEVE